MIKVENVGFSYSNRSILEGITFAINPGDRIGLVGPNGVGKTTLLRLIADDISPTSGSIAISNDNIGYLPQDISPWNDYSGVGYLKEVTGIASAEKALEEASNTDKPDDDKIQASVSLLESLDAYTFDARAKSALAKVKLEHVALDQKVETLSGGQKTRLSLAAIFVDRHNTLLLDEPTNSLDLEGLALLEEFLLRNKNVFVIVSHDRRFLQRVATKIVAIGQDIPGVEVYNLGYEEFVQAREKKRESARLAYGRFQEEKTRLKQAYYSKASDTRAADRSKKRTDNEKLARNAVREKAVGAHAAAAHALKTRLEKLEPPESPERELDLNFKLKTSDRSGDVVVRLNEASVTFDSTGKRIGPFNLTVQRGDRIIVTGLNGSGKSTLLRLISGELKPTAGTVTVGSGVNVGIIDQDHEILARDKTVLECATELVSHDSSSRTDQAELRQILAMFGINADKVHQTTGELSPGERSRVLLATLVARGTNVLLLDEPTNHLDIDASEELEKAIASYRSTYIIVTHDREFIDNIGPNRTLNIVDGLIE